MASDMQCTSGNRKFTVCKVRRTKSGSLVGGAGNLAHILKVLRWVEAGMKGDRPDFGEGEGEFECLIVDSDRGLWLLDEELELMKVEDGFLAIGSGGAYAVAAMECGRTAEEAVEVAAKFDPATGGPIQVWRLEAPKAKRLKK